jgi:HPt (histidine-containing phosphotransfer) domain-containing protein
MERLTRLGGTKLVRQLIELYLAHGPERVRAIEAGVETGDAKQVERAAHSLKSSAGNLGARRLQHTAEAVEAAAAGGLIDDDLTARIVQEYEESAVLLRSAMEEDAT